FRNMFIFEGRKLRREEKVRRVILILVIVIIGGYFILTLTTKKLQKDYISRTEIAFAASKSSYERIVEDLEKSQALIEKFRLKEESLTALERRLNKGAEAVVNSGEQNLNLHRTDFEEKSSILDAYQANDWTVVYNSWIDEIIRWREDKSYIDTIGTEKGRLSNFTYMASIEQYNWMKEH